MPTSFVGKPIADENLFAPHIKNPTFSCELKNMVENTAKNTSRIYAIYPVSTADGGCFSGGAEGKR